MLKSYNFTAKFDSLASANTLRAATTSVIVLRRVNAKYCFLGLYVVLTIISHPHYQSIRLLAPCKLLTC